MAQYIMAKITNALQEKDMDILESNFIAIIEYMRDKEETTLEL